MFKLTAERQRRNWSKAELARRSRLDQGNLGKIESGRVRPYPRELHRLARALGIPATAEQSLLEEETAETPRPRSVEVAKNARERTR
jgi:transcriptional regulator with XRE-family HTH domain